MNTTKQDLNQYIPHFWKEDNNNNNNDNEKQQQQQQQQPNNEQPNLNILTILRKYQKIFTEIETLISTWEYSENNLYIVFKNIISFLERYNILINSSVNNSSNSDNNDSSGIIKSDYFKIFNTKIQQQKSISIETELQLKIIDKLEESMLSMYEYQSEMKKVIEKFELFKIEIDQYWDNNIISSQSSIPIDKNIYLKIIDLNKGSFSNAPITQIDQWFHFIVNQFKLEFQRRDNLLKQVEYNKPLKYLNSIFENYEKNQILSITNIKEIIPKVIGVIKEQ